MLTYCPCCGEEFNNVDVCPDCDLKTIVGSRPEDFDGFCVCDELKLRVMHKDPLL